EQSQALSSEDSESPARAPKPGARVANGPKAVETPVIVTREPEQADSKPTQKGADTSSIVGPADDSANQSAVRTGETGESAKTETKQDSGALKAAAVGNTAEAEDKAQFQLPGSLKVRIHDYSGDLPKWAVMVILDDSVSMTRKTKNWAAGKMQTAETVVSRIASALPPGSKLAVRDFTCGNSDEKKSKKAPCLSRMVYEWAESPYSGLKEKVGQTVAGGPTNPCAAAAYSLKKDFGSDHLIPRILVVTDGTAKCAFNEVVKALDQHKAKGKVGVDVVAVGMGKKRQAGYATLTKKTDGMLLKIERPGDLDAGVSRYVKALRTPMMEKVEVKGENSVFTMHPQEEITLPPGTYTVVLPVVVGLNPAKRIVPHVKINSGEANILDVRIRKGKPTIKLGKK
ncbi:MAG TPA: hypothetical protein VK463_16360, partial [Desulfomonilaceae bacterium]|nr:hypothetical protein [Desulfomonilaceae bacterium]